MHEMKRTQKSTVSRINLWTNLPVYIQVLKNLSTKTELSINCVYLLFLTLIGETGGLVSPAPSETKSMGSDTGHECIGINANQRLT